MPYAIDPVGQRGPAFPGGTIIAPDKSFGETHNHMANLAGYQRWLDADAWQKWRMFFVGYIRYGDLLGGVYITGFCLMFDHLGSRFVRTGPDTHNCNRTEIEPGTSGT
jgi:hypothetical protein